MLGSNLPSDNHLRNVIKLIPVLVLFNQVSMQRLKFRPSWECNIKSLGCEEGLSVKEIEVVGVIKVAEELVGESVQVAHDGEGKIPLLVGRSVDILGLLERFEVIKEVKHGRVLGFVEFHLDGLNLGACVEDVLAVVKRGFFGVERGEAHSFEVLAVSFFSAHHHPHGGPLSCVYRFDYLWNISH